jgi:molybdenum cofactor cytidylyltransferase
MTAAIILAAGGSTRLGQPKQLVLLKGETFLERAVRTAKAAGCQPIAVVLGASANDIQTKCNLQDAAILFNPHWKSGMGSSVNVGLRAVEQSEGVVVMTCDQPAVTSTHLRALMASGRTTASAYAGRRGVPAYFPASIFPKLMQLEGDAGARELLRDADTVPLPGGELDIDTPEDLAKLAE